MGQGYIFWKNKIYERSGLLDVSALQIQYLPPQVNHRTIEPFDYRTAGPLDRRNNALHFFLFSSIAVLIDFQLILPVCIHCGLIIGIKYGVEINFSRFNLFVLGDMT